MLEARDAANITHSFPSHTSKALMETLVFYLLRAFEAFDRPILPFSGELFPGWVLLWVLLHLKQLLSILQGTVHLAGVRFLSASPDWAVLLSLCWWGQTRYPRWTLTFPGCGAWPQGLCRKCPLEKESLWALPSPQGRKLGEVALGSLDPLMWSGLS